ncbi:hypothetical protein BDY21DRAFT_341058 [Lineolata rhizophorae]|uniref:Uncharacterized protein n=1 Tax=Lineolata rhizophorae TaxID=578093 RepID=A0A6A6P3W8_9PEZI|nr:hypothetical protein BDY21DRAFT_341058 [Lineolata rhizophorae]
MRRPAAPLLDHGNGRMMIGLWKTATLGPCTTYGVHQQEFARQMQARLRWRCQKAWSQRLWRDWLVWRVSCMDRIPYPDMWDLSGKELKDNPHVDVM